MPRLQSQSAIRLALVGAGRMGRAHLEAIDHAGSATAVAVVDPVPARRELAVQRDLDVYATVGELIDAGGIDAALVAAPSQLHLPIVSELLGARVPVLCEKPGGLRSDEVSAAAGVAERQRVVLQVGYWRRFVAELIDLRGRIAGGGLGELFHLRCAQWDEEPPEPGFRSQSGGIVIDMGVHEFDLIQWLTGQSIAEVVGMPSTPPTAPPIEGDPESVELLCRLSAGTVATVSLGRRFSRGDCCWVEATGTRGHARNAYACGSPGVRVFQRALAAQVDAFAEAVQGRPAQGATGEDAVAALDAAERGAIEVAGRLPCVDG